MLLVFANSLLNFYEVKMKNLINLLLVSAFAVSCVNLNGQLNVKTPMNVKVKGGFLNLKTKNVELAAGAYRAELKVNSAKSFSLKLRLDKEDDKDITIPLKSEKEFDLPSNGAVRVAGKDISQPFDLNGTITTTISSSDPVRTYESCSYTRYERRCEVNCRRTDRGALHCDCRDVLVTLYGTRIVDSHYNYTHRNLEAELLDESSRSQLATLSASGTESDRVTDYYGECRR